MTEITLKLTLEELKQIDKFVELNDETRPLFDKIRNAYPEPETLFDVIRNLGYSVDDVYEIVDAVEEFEKSKEPEKWNVVRESKKWCEENPDESVEDYLKPHTPVEEAYKRWYPSSTPGVSYFDDNMWSAFQKGYKSAQQDYKVGEYQPTPQEPEDNEWKTVALGFGENLSAIGPCGYYDFTPVEWYDWVVDIYENTANEYLKLLEKERAKAKAQKHEKWNVVRESKKWCEEHPDESVEDYLTPHTPEKTEKLLREAFQKVQQTEEWKETQRKIDSKNPPKFLKFELGRSLDQLIERWWCDVFVGPNEKWTMEECIADLCDRIHLWLPKEQSANSQNVDVEFLVEGFNDAIKKIKSKLRNKKDT